MSPPDPRGTSGQVPITMESDIVLARRTARDVSNGLGFGLTDVTRIVTAASELARNVICHARGGTMRWAILDDPRSPRVGVEFVFEDRGPGIPDISKALQEGWSTGGGLGMGLPGTRRLMDEMDIQSTVGVGTAVTVRKWRRR